jgi:hypothetical protein
MIVCIKCGATNPDDAQWCDTCGSFLEWDGEKVAPRAAGTPRPEPPVPVAPDLGPPPPPARAGLLKRIQAAIGGNRGRPRGQAPAS